MSNTNVDEDWESAGLNLENLKIKSDEIDINIVNQLKESQIQKEVSSVFVLPQRLMSRPIPDDIQFMRTDLKPIAAPISFNDEPIDQVIIDAANNPRERMIVLNIENSILTFVKSEEKTLEIPPLHNAFRRLLTYRIAQRFLLFHTNSDNVNEGGDRGILLHKTPETSIPKQLVIDYKDDYNNDDFNNNSNNNNNNGNTSITTSVLVPVKKMMVLKRNPNSNENLKKINVNNRQNKSDLDKEKAYAEARARIFGEEAIMEGNVDDINSNRTISPTPVINQVKFEQEPISNQPIHRTLSSEFLGDSDNCSDANNTRSNKKIIDTSSWKTKKSLIRNRNAEQSDPDFVRRGNNVSNYQSQQMNNYDQYNDRNVGDYNNQVPYGYNNPNQYQNLVQSNNYSNQSGPNSILWSHSSQQVEFNNNSNPFPNSNQNPYYQQNNQLSTQQGYQYPSQQQQGYQQNNYSHQQGSKSRENFMNNSEYPPLN